jgi:hypothetical protein
MRQGLVEGMRVMVRRVMEEGLVVIEGEGSAADVAAAF